jgi:hypothetical protein
MATGLTARTALVPIKCIEHIFSAQDPLAVQLPLECHNLSYGS